MGRCREHSEFTLNSGSLVVVVALTSELLSSEFTELASSQYPTSYCLVTAVTYALFCAAVGKTASLPTT